MLLMSMAKRAAASSPPVQIDIQIERWPIERLIPRGLTTDSRNYLRILGNIEAFYRTSG